MQNLPVHWSEGMFLRPHHFQAADRYWGEIAQSSQQWNQSYNYGLRSIAFSPEAIANSQLEVSACEARLRDGTLVSRAAGQEFPRIDLKSAFERETSVTVYLALPLLRLGQPNVGPTGSPDHCRFVENVRSVQDESAGGNDFSIAFRELNVRLLLSTEDTAGYEILPILRIKRAGDKEGVPQVDTDYIPPLLTVEGWHELRHGIVRVIYDLIGQKIDVLTQQVLSRGMTLASQHPGDLDRVLMLRVLNEAYAVLGCKAFASGIHPLTVYDELCRIVGMLSIFGPARRIGDVPHYDHDDLDRIFRWARREIELLLLAVRDYEFERRDFIGAGEGMEVALESKWVSNDWRWYVGVQGSGITQREIQDLLTIPGRGLDWKMAATGRVDQAYRMKIPGLRLVLSAQPPRELPTGGEWIYFEVSRDNTVEWAEVTRTLTLGLRVNAQVITNLKELQGQKELGVKWAGKYAQLAFALFAVHRPGGRPQT